MDYTEIFTREMFVEELACNLSDEELNRLFGVTKEELENFDTLVWNEALEYEYSNMIAEAEYADEKMKEGE